MDPGRERTSKKAIIPQPRRIKRKLKELESAFSDFVACHMTLLERYLRVRPLGDHESLVREYGFYAQVPAAPAQNLQQVEVIPMGTAWDNIDRHRLILEKCKKLAVELVRLDNSQLHHPAVRFLLETASRKFLRRLHRGLETGAKRGIESIKGVSGNTEEERYSNALMVLNILNQDRMLRDLYGPGDRPHLDSWREDFLQKMEQAEAAGQPKRPELYIVA